MTVEFAHLMTKSNLLYAVFQLHQTSASFVETLDLFGAELTQLEVPN